MNPVEQAKVDERYLNGEIEIHQVGKEWGGLSKYLKMKQARTTLPEKACLI